MSEVKTRVPDGLSDLFFNRDLSECVIKDERGNFESYDRPKMLGEAEATLTALESLGLRDLPSADDLVVDYLDRV
jgi:hypothetical protein